MDYKETFAQRLINLREQKNITQQELADELGITRQSLSLYEKAERTINIELLAKIADFFNVSTDYLMGRTDTETLNEDIQTACKVTGLSEDAVKNIRKITMQENEKNMYKELMYIINSCTSYQEDTTQLKHIFINDKKAFVCNHFIESDMFPKIINSLYDAVEIKCKGTIEEKGDKYLPFDLKNINIPDEVSETYRKKHTNEIKRMYKQRLIEIYEILNEYIEKNEHLLLQESDENG